MHRSERRRQERENRNRDNAIVLYAGPSQAILTVVQQFIREHEGHTLDVEENLKNSLTLCCGDCDDADEIDK
jgi:hypothetical protein